MRATLDGAISQFRSAIAAKADYAQAHFQLGLALRRKGEKDEAEKELRRAAEIDPRLAAASKAESGSKERFALPAAGKPRGTETQSSEKT